MRLRQKFLGIAALVGVITVGAAVPAMAFGTGTVGAAPGCTGTATSASYPRAGAGNGAVASTAESGNLCLSKQTVGAGLLAGGGGLVGFSTAYDSVVVVVTSGTFYGGYHTWGTSSGTT